MVGVSKYIDYFRCGDECYEEDRLMVWERVREGEVGVGFFEEVILC